MKLIIGSQYPINGPWSKSKHTVLSLLNCQISAPSSGILIPYWGLICFLIHSSHVQFYNNNKTFSLCKKTINIVLILQRNQGSEWPSTVTQQIIGKKLKLKPSSAGFFTQFSYHHTRQNRMLLVNAMGIFKAWSPQRGWSMCDNTWNIVKDYYPCNYYNGCNYLLHLSLLLAKTKHDLTWQVLLALLWVGAKVLACGKRKGDREISEVGHPEEEIHQG